MGTSHIRQARDIVDSALTWLTLSDKARTILTEAANLIECGQHSMACDRLRLVAHKCADGDLKLVENIQEAMSHISAHRPKPVETKWQHTILSGHSTFLLIKLGELGAQGWEAVGITYNHETGLTNVLMKRRTPEDES